ncbi:MAG: hypothetical protein ACKOYQ_00760, partial [Actinomycetota bacterium]
MTLALPGDLTPVFVSGLLGVAVVEEGPTSEQLKVINALARHLWAIDSSGLGPMEPSAVAEGVHDLEHRRRFVQFAIVISFCRHPNSQEQVSRMEAYASALGITGDQIEAEQRWISEDAERASADFMRTYANYLPDLSDPVGSDAGDGEALPEVEALKALPEGTLGRAFLA